MPYLSRLSTRLALRFAGAVALLASAACSDGLSAPGAPGADASLDARIPAAAVPTVDFSYGSSGKSRGVRRDRPIEHGTASADIDQRGGVLEIREAGLRVVVPPLALRKRTRLTLSVVPGEVLAYEFEPHGLVFDVPLLMQQDLSGSSWAGSVLELPQVGYFASDADLDVTTGDALISEWMPGGVMLFEKKLYALIPHFSGYMVSSGRR